jgi:hypothetical protein
VRAKKTTSWFGVRTLFRVVAIGKPKRIDRYFDPAATLVEDRVVLFQATDSDAAIRQAEAEARRYCRLIKYANIYGQQVRLKFLGNTDAFSMLDGEPSAGCEVYSTTAIVPSSVRDTRVVAHWWGKKQEGAWQVRNKFIDGKLLSEAFAAIKKADATRSTRPAARKKRRN